MSATDRAIATLDPISLEAANAAAELQTRVDRKYLVVEPALIGLLAGVGSAVRVLDCDGERAIAYRSTYFDTADFALFRAAAQGRRQRFKVRSRTYGERGPSVLEVKARGIRGTTVKSRIDYTHQDRDTVTPDGRQFVAAVTGRPDLAAALRPALSTAYHRTTLIDPISHTRLTFDRDVECIDPDGTRASLGSIVVETKSARAPSAADQWLWHHGIRPATISKYCSGLAATRPELRGNKWHRVIAGNWSLSVTGNADDPLTANLPRS